MRQVYLGNQLVEVSERTFWESVEHIVKGMVDTIAATLHSGVDGFPRDMGGDFINLDWVKAGHDNIQNILPEIDDTETANLLRSLDQKIQELYTLNDALVNAIAAYFNLPAPQSKPDYKKLLHIMNRSGGPVWHNTSGFQQAARDLTQAFQDVQTIKIQIEHKIAAQLSMIMEGSVESEYIYNVLEELESLTNQYQGEADIDLSDMILDQLAKELIDEQEQLATSQIIQDLIDSGEQELDPRRAIQIFHLALRYHPTDMYSSQAYAGIAAKYEVVGVPEKAIEYYTQAIEKNDSNARLFLSRGELYYRTKELGKARDDFTQALRISPGKPEDGGLFSDEYQSVESYLTELKRASQ